MTGDFLTKSKELADELAPTHAQMATFAERLWELKQARMLLPGGEVLSQDEWKRESEALADALRRYVQEFGDLHIEGVPRIFLQLRRGPWIWDVYQMSRDASEVYGRLLATPGAVTLNTKLVEALEKAGAVTGFRRFGIQSEGTPALMFERKGQ